MAQAASLPVSLPTGGEASTTGVTRCYFSQYRCHFHAYGWHAVKRKLHTVKHYVRIGIRRAQFKNRP